MIKTTMKAAFVAVIALTGLVSLHAEALRVDVSLDRSSYVSGAPRTAYVKVGLSGTAQSDRSRPELNVALVLDRSGSMQGEKLEQAREAARYAVGLLAPQDFLSLVVYDTEVRVLVPSTRVQDKARFYRAIDEIYAGSSTALFAGVSRGAQEVRRRLSSDRVNRVILLSDGIANVGPDSPAALQELGRGLRREGVSVTTIGLGSGYNEDLMTRLAAAADGNHAFVESPRDLVRVFDAEFRDVLSIAALDIKIEIDCAKGVRPIRIMNREGDIRDGRVYVNLNQVLASQEKYVLVELELPPSETGRTRDVASAKIAYRGLDGLSKNVASPVVQASYTADSAIAAKSVKPEVREQVVLQLATEANEEAVRLRDEGKTKDAKKVLEDNATFLRSEAAGAPSPALKEYAEKNAADAEAVSKDDWTAQRKSMRESQYQNKTQQSY
ncbi:MAG: VWA domain-containing protein [Treponemataceae bacterium]